jgi:hypothetical protein
MGLRTSKIFDTRNLYDSRDMNRLGIEYFPGGARVQSPGGAGT